MEGGVGVGVRVRLGFGFGVEMGENGEGMVSRRG